MSASGRHRVTRTTELRRRLERITRARKVRRAPDAHRRARGEEVTVGAWADAYDQLKAELDAGTPVAEVEKHAAEALDKLLTDD